MPTDTDDSHARKLVAILAADVAGYSKLMADDEVATMRTLTAYREVFAEHVTGHKGRIVDTAGDSVLATFESVVEAVEAAVDVQRDLAERNEVLSGHRKMHFRIGVNLGDIIVRDDGTIYGDGVNIAARLESLAGAGWGDDRRLRASRGRGKTQCRPGGRRGARGQKHREAGAGVAGFVGWFRGRFSGSCTSNATGSSPAKGDRGAGGCFGGRGGFRGVGCHSPR